MVAPSPHPTLPTVDELLGPAAQLPTADELLGVGPGWGFQHGIMSGPGWDEYVKQAPLGRVLNAFGQGAAQGWGTSSLGFTPEVEEALKKYGIFNDVQQGQHSAIRSFNEAIMRPAAAAADAAWRAGSALFGGATEAVRAAAEELPTGPDLGPNYGGVSGYLREGLASLLSPQEMARGLITAQGAFAAGEPTGVPRVPPLLLPEVEQFHVGESESAYFGTTNPLRPSPETTADMVRRAQEEAANANEVGRAPSGYEPGALGPPATEAPIAPRAEPVPEPKTVDEAARRIAPETFDTYDALAAQRDDLRQQIATAREDLERNAAAQAPHAAEIADLRERLRDTTPRLAKKYQARLDAIEADHDAFFDSDQYALLTRDTDEMGRMRDQLQRIDYRMRDLAPDVSAAYRQAAEQFPEPAPAEVAPPVAAEAPAAEPVGEQPAPAAPAAAEAPPEAAPAAPTPTPAATQPEGPEAAREAAEKAERAEQPAAKPVPVVIAQDVSRKLVAAGRPQEEADAAGAVLQAYYETRAARFQGALGTPQELYEREGPDIRAGEAGGRRGAAAGKLRIPELAQRGRGAVEQRARPIITLFRRADASTFIHETGHQWLEDMLRDARNEHAPEDLTRDAAAVRHWLGAEPDAAITTAQHERFARGFERYMMEGVAPTRALDRVFAQFREWLTKLYQTVAKLRAPITDDIRDVFDRLLSTSPEPAALAPEPVSELREETAPSHALPPDWQERTAAATNDLAALHESDATDTPPADAAQVADEVKTERESETQRLEDARRVAAGAAAKETGAGVGSGAEPAEPGATTGPSSEPSRSISEPATVGAGGGSASSEGNRPPEQPTFPAEPYTDPADRYVDKAGNIRLELLTDDAAARAALREMAERNGEFMDARRGVVSDAQVLDLADMINATAADLNIQRLRQMSLEDGVPMAARIRAGRHMLLQAEAAVREAAAKGDPQAFIMAADRLNMVQETVSGITAEWGRAGRAFRDMRETTGGARQIADIVQQATGRTLFQIQRQMNMIRELGTPAQVAKFTRDAARQGLFDWLQSAFINALLSGPFTHAGYTVAGELYALFRATAETGAAGAVGAIRRALGGEGGAQFGEVPHELYGIFRGAISGAQASWKAFKANEPVLPPEVAAMDELPSRPIGMHGSIPNPTIGGVRVPIGTVLESPSRLVTALHTYNWTTFYSGSISAQAFRVASSEGLTGTRLADRIAALTENPTESMIETASREASEGALMQRPSYDSLMGHISRLTNYGIQVPDLPLPGGRTLPMGTFRPIKFIDPFVTIAANVQRAAFGRGTPLALFSPEVRADLMMRNGAEAFDRRAGRLLAGTSFMIAAGGLAAKGLLNGSGPSDRQQAAEWRRIHGQPHGLVVGDTSFNVLRLGALGMQMSVAADLWNVAHLLTQEDANKVAAEVVHAFAQNILDESFMRGPSEMMLAVQDSNRYGAAWVRNFVTSAVPFSVGLGQVAREIDPYSRQARTTMDAILAKLPGASERLLPRYDVWGQPMRNYGWAGTYYGRIDGDATDAALYRLGVYPSQPQRRIRGVELTDQQFDEYARTSGRMAKARLDALVQTPGFSLLPDLVKVDSIHATIASARAAAQALVMIHSAGTPHDIARQAIEAKRQQLTPTH